MKDKTKKTRPKGKVKKDLKVKSRRQKKKTRPKDKTEKEKP